MSIFHPVGNMQNYHNSKVDTVCEDTQREFYSLDHIVPYLFHKEVLTDIECRKITCTSRLIEKRAAIYQIILNKKPEAARDLLKFFQSNVHALHNPKLLARVFSFLEGKDVTNCRLVCHKWKAGVDILLDNYSAVKFMSFRQQNTIQDEINKLNHLLQELLEKNKNRFNRNSDPEILELQASIVQLMLTANPTNEEIAFEAIRRSMDVQTNSRVSLNSESGATGEEKDNLIANTLQIDAVLNHIFGFLRLKDIKSCRIVCRQWNSIAEPFLRNKGRIRFTSSFRPRNFINTFKYLLPDLPFKTFKLETEKFGISELTDFFSKWGKNVENLHMHDVNLKSGISICISHTIHLTELHLKGINKISDVPTELMVPWEKLFSVNILYLEHIIVNVNTNNQRVRPCDVHLNNVQFFFGGKERESIILNDVVDFSKARDIRIVKCTKQRQTFDWTKDDIDADTITVDGIYFANSPYKAKIRSLNLSHCTLTVY